MIRSRLLSVASKQGDISFYIDHRGPRKGSVSDNGKTFATEKRMQEARKDGRTDGQRRKRDTAVTKMPARAQSMTSVQTQTVMKMTQEVEAGDDGGIEMQDPRDLRGRQR